MWRSNTPSSWSKASKDARCGPGIRRLNVLPKPRRRRRRLQWCATLLAYLHLAYLICFGFAAPTVPFSYPGSARAPMASIARPSCLLVRRHGSRTNRELESHGGLHTHIIRSSSCLPEELRLLRNGMLQRLGGRRRCCRRVRNRFRWLRLSIPNP